MTALDNYVSRFIFEELDICGALVHLGSAWRDMHSQRDYPPRVQHLLGEMAVVSGLMGNLLKTAGRLTFQARGEESEGRLEPGAGHVSLLVVDCERRADEEALLIRGMARCQGDPGGRPLREVLGDGQLLFSLQSEVADMPYQSYVSLAGDSMAQIFEQFMAQSVQQETRLWLSADDQHACGLLLQTLPPRARETTVDADGWSRVQQLAATIRPVELRLAPEELLGRLFPEDDIRLFAARPLAYYCPRDEDKVRCMLLSLGRDEVAEVLAEQGEIVIRDDICNHEYRFGPAILDELFPSAGQTLH